ncbi:hypothetical protein [Pseudomonas putida]
MPAAGAVQFIPEAEDVAVVRRGIAVAADAMVDMVEVLQRENLLEPPPISVGSSEAWAWVVMAAMANSKAIFLFMVFSAFSG